MEITSLFKVLQTFRFLFDKRLVPTTEYRFLKEQHFNPTNTFIYADRVVLVTWGNPVTAIMIKNSNIMETYKTHFEYLWNLAEKQKSVRKEG